MGTIRRTEITVETERLLIITRNREVLADWCEGCGRETRLLTAEEATTAAAISLRALCRLVEANKLHFVETKGGALLICSDSLVGQSGEPK